MTNTHNKSGFSLIELLVVIAIIGLLAVMAVVSLNNAREKARDAKRMGDIKAIQTAIEFYIQSNGHAPDLGNPTCLVPTNMDATCYTNDMNDTNKIYHWSDLQAQLSQYLPTLPVDPCGESCKDKQISNSRNDGFFTYRYTAPGEGFSGNPNLSSSDYAIFAQNLETREASFGFGAGSF